MIISSENYIDCDAALSHLQGVTNYYIDTHVSKTNVAYQKSCSGASKLLKPSPQLSAADKVGVAVAIGIPGLLLIFWILYKRWKKNIEGELVFVFAHNNMENLGGGGEHGANAVPGNTPAASR
jgi:hypothetical protein